MPTQGSLPASHHLDVVRHEPTLDVDVDQAREDDRVDPYGNCPSGGGGSKSLRNPAVSRQLLDLLHPIRIPFSECDADLLAHAAL